ncbi:MAG TPA: class I SAM-dependent methyltransferase [Gemmatimonadaceae bacterium]|nr:class I SAM-dependent methyltransferase [Gemmatimonadaceae bacterium]
MKMTGNRVSGEVTADLLDRSEAKTFYDARYQAGYMDQWGSGTKSRIADVIRELGLPATGDALDFGCGSGALTEIICNELPGWKVYGTDLSDVAIDNARIRVPGCVFLHGEDPALESVKVDFLFSHHVLEHVDHVDSVVKSFANRVRPGGFMLHVLPCGNEGSLEHELVGLHRNGADPAREGRWFFEDVSHLRRLTSDQLTAICARHGFEPAGEWYTGQEAGAISWITENGPGIAHKMTDPAMGVDPAASMRLRQLRRKLLPLSIARRPAVWARNRLERRQRSLKDWAQLAVLAIPAAISWPLDSMIRRRAAAEWDTRRHDRRGSEMFLAFRRSI